MPGLSPGTWPLTAALLLLAGLLWAVPAGASDARRGAYLFDAASCHACHTDTDNRGEPLAGGRAITTPFGIFYSPNITPHRQHGIGGWTLPQFRRALRHGEAPDGSAYYPVFPYPAYTQMSDQDIADLWSYLQTREPVATPNLDHQVPFPLNFRLLISAWQWLFHHAGVYQADSTRSEAWNRGAYLVRALGHCGECHTPRNRFGALDPLRELAGNPEGPDGDAVPNITPDKETGIGLWSDSELHDLFTSGMLPDGDFVGAGMGEVVDHSLSRLTAEDRDAIITYLRALPPKISPRPQREPPDGSDDDFSSRLEHRLSVQGQSLAGLELRSNKRMELP